jgi:ubiquinone/menaquinone biosynthesis C-methylase UbiE
MLMQTAGSDSVFSGSIPEIYDTLLVPMVFDAYAVDLAARVSPRRPARVLELAAGTGALTRRLAAGLPESTSIVATDLNPAMLARAQAIGTCRPVQWQCVDAMQLPFADGAFDCVVCQFGVMFFPDKPAAFAQARRVLAPGGALVFNVWDRLEDSEFAWLVTQTLAELFPANPPRFMVRTPHGYHDRSAIERDLAQGGFATPPVIQALAARSRARSAEVPAIAYCQGTPLRGEIEAQGPGALEQATRACAVRLAARFGTGAVDGKLQALVVTVEA